MKTRLLFVVLVGLLIPFQARSQYAMWVGESRQFDVSSSVIGSTRNVSWTTNGGYLSLSGTGMYRKVTVTQYFGGSADVVCSWEYRLTYGGSWTKQTKRYTITCNENPVSISPTSLTLAPGQSAYLSYSHKYTNSYTNAANAYFSSDGGGGVISVSRDGRVTAHRTGQAYVNVYSKISNAANAPYCLVTVKEIDPTSVSLSESVTIVEGNTYTLTPSLYPSGATSSFVWSSEDEEIATVSSGGTVTGVKAGKTRIKVTTTKGGYSDYCNVIVKAPPVPPSGVSLPEKITIYKGFSTVVSPTLEPVIAETTYMWSSEDPSVVSISSAGKITAQKVGQTQITVTTANNLTASCTVVVTEVPEHIDSDELAKRINLLKSLAQSTLKYVE